MYIDDSVMFIYEEKNLWSGHFCVQKETVVVCTSNAKIYGSFVTNSSILCKCFTRNTQAECWMLTKLEKFEALRVVFMKTRVFWDLSGDNW